MKDAYAREYLRFDPTDTMSSGNGISRRDFLKDAAFGTGLAASSYLGLSRPVEGAPNPGGQVETAVLGDTGEEVSKMGIGCAPFQAGHIDSDHLRKVFERCLELGINYLDVAPNYGNSKRGFSEVKMGPALEDIRDQFFLVTKTESPTRDGTWKLLEQSMNRMKTDYLDLVHIHNFGHEGRFENTDRVLGKQGTLGALREAKEQGVIRYIGATGHQYPSRFHEVLDTGEIDVLMNAVNYVVQHSYDFEHKVWSRARREDVGLVAMKVLGGSGGDGFRLPDDQYENAIRYALSIPGLATAVIGVQNVAELDQAADVVINSAPLSEQERRTLKEEGLKLARTDRWRAAYGKPVT